MNATSLLLKIGTAFLLPVAVLAVEPKEILLWPDGAPGSEGKTVTKSCELRGRPS